MSSYRSNYVPWTKNSLGSTYSGSSVSKSDSATKSKYDSGSLSRPSSRAENRIESDRPTVSSLGSNYRSSSYISGIPRDRSSTRESSRYGALSPTPSSKDQDKSPSYALREKYTIPDKPTTSKYISSSGTYPGRSDLVSRIKSVTDKKDTPPITYHTLNRPGTRSRDPSPAERDKTDNYRLYPRSYTRSSSREPDPSTTLKYSSKTPAASREDLTSISSRYGTGRTSRIDTKDDLTSRLRSTSRSSREELTSSLPRYSSSRHSSKEDLSLSSTKYINSRFLPRNSIEKSYNTYTKPSSRSTSSVDDKRRSKENLLGALQTSRSSTGEDKFIRKSLINSASLKPSRSPLKDLPKSSPQNPSKPTLKYSTKEPQGKISKSSTANEKDNESEEETTDEESEEEEFETVTVITRATSPTPPSQSVARTRRGDMARLLQKDITRPKKRKNMVDKEMQSDRMDDTARYSRFGSSSTVAAPWSSYLDLKYNSPRTNYSSTTSSKYSSPNYSYKSKENNSSSLGEKPGDSKDSKDSRDNSVSQETELSTEISTSEKVSERSAPEQSEKTGYEKISSLKSTKKLSSDKSSSESINSLSRNNSSKSISLKAKSDQKSKEIPKARSSSASSLSGENTKAKLSKQSSPDISSKKLPPPVPKGEASQKSTGLIPNGIQNKDFRKSVLNMNTDGKLVKMSSKRSSSVSSDSEQSSVATGADTQINNLTSLSSTKQSSSSSLPKAKSSSSLSKLPQKFSSKSDKSLKETDKTRRSPSLESSTSTVSSSEDDTQKSKNKTSSKRKLQSAGSSRTSMQLSSADELSVDRPAKPPPSPRPKNESGKTEAEAKSFLMRALAPVTNFFKAKPTDDDKSENVGENRSDKDVGDKSNKKGVLRREESGERARRFDDNADPPDGVQKFLGEKVGESSQVSERIGGSPQTGKKISGSSQASQKTGGSSQSSEKTGKSAKSEKTTSSSQAGEKKGKVKLEKPKKIILKRVESGERAWWLDNDAEPPEGITRFSTEDLKKLSSSPQNSEKVSFKFVRQDSGEEPWWMNENTEAPEGVIKFPTNGSQIEVNDGKHVYKIRKNESGQVEWWLESSESSKNSSKKTGKVQKTNHRPKDDNSQSQKKWIKPSKEDMEDESSDSESDEDKLNEPLGDRASPDGLEMPREPENSGRLSPYDNIPSTYDNIPGTFDKLPTDSQKRKRPNRIPLFISRHTNIDDILGGSNQLLSPLMDRIFSFQEKKLEEECEEVDPGQVRIHDSTAQRPVIQPGRIDVIEGFPNSSSDFTKLDDAALQLYKDGDYGSYLDLEASISEQQEEFEGFETNKKNSIVLRTQLSVRVHTIIEKLLTSEGRELRRALFSLKQIFQEDKDLVHEFVQNDGLACLIKVGSEADQNYQNYILRALGQVMLYVDGMNGVIEHNQTVQWLYTLIASKFRLVVKTALKLLLVFVEYTDSNCMLLVKAVNTVDASQGLISWTNIMRLLKDFNSADTELLIYAMTLVNKCLNGIPDQDTYYDQVDALEEQGIEGIIQRYMSKQGTDLDLLQQFQIYEAVLQHEDGEDKGMPLRHLDESIRKTLRNRKAVLDNSERRKSRRHSTGNTPMNNNNASKMKFYSLQSNTVDDEDESSSSQSSGHNDHNLNGSYKENNKANDAGVTPALRRRRERAERQRSFIREQQESAAILRASLGIAEDAENGNYTNNLQQRMVGGNLQLSRTGSRKDLTPLMNAVNKLDSSEEGILKKPWVLQMMYPQESNDDTLDNTNENDLKMLNLLKRENTVKDLTQKLTNPILLSPSDDNKLSRIGDMTGLISKAKEGLAKSKSKADILKSPTSENLPKGLEVKKSENELRWEELVHSMNRPLSLCDLDFTDLQSEDEVDILAPAISNNGIPPPPPPLCKDSAPPPPPIANRNPPPFPTTPCFGINQRVQRPCQEAPKSNTIKKNKKTVKLFWKEVRDDPIALSKLQKYGGMIWDELSPVCIDTQKLEHLFESRAKDLISKKQQEMNKNKEIIVLDHKRSNAINIGMTKLPPPRSIKTAILKMDATIMNREGIEKLLTMLPTEEERTKIQEAQSANPDLPLGSAEQFLLTLASISELPARLKLWAFKLDFENLEREIAEPLMDLKQGTELLKGNKTFRGILSTLLSIGIFLNGAEVKGFQIEYLAKVPEVKDTVHKHSLLHHLCHIVMEKFPEATDLYSEIGAITRASKIDFDELTLNIQRLEADCKASWDHLKLIAKHDGSTMMKVKMSDFLADCAERIILLGIIHRRVMNRYHKFLLWLGIPLHRVADSKPNEFCRIVSEFSLEYRTTRERVLQQLEKKANHRERNKTRGKMITEVGKFKSKEDRADAELRQLLGSDMSDVESMQGTLPWRRQRRDPSAGVRAAHNGHLTDDGDDEILESLVKTATKAPANRATPRERKRTRHADRKSLKRSRTRENNPFGSRDSP